MPNLPNTTKNSKTPIIPPLRRAQAEALVLYLTKDLTPPCYLQVGGEFYMEIENRFEWTKAEVNRALEDAHLLKIARLTSDEQGV